MRMTKSGQKLVVEANVSAKDTFLYLGVGLVFTVGGLALLSSGISLVSLLFTALGMLTLLAFVSNLKQTCLTYTFDPSARQLYLSHGSAISFSNIQSAAAHTETWKGTYGETHQSHSVRLKTAGQTFSMPANSLAEANHVAAEIRKCLAQ
ncbi:MAG: hypothetical protein F6J97_18995 [Leptolyngbya sp. SIO4C1]|nr:hypothetical protein [Leptolyngbya sp. SIO4C1]